MANKEKLSIKHWAEDDRPREKLLIKGVSTLSDAEILAILIGSGNREESAVELSRRILCDFNGNLNELARLSVSDLCVYKGIGDAKAVTIVAALELGRRRKLSLSLERKKILSSKDVFEIYHPLLADLPHEEFWVLLMNNANRIIGNVKLTQGGSRQTIVDIPMLLRLVLEKSAYTIAVAHNHPSGQCSPSAEDKLITKKIMLGCKAVGVHFLDHLIVAEDSYYSFADEGELYAENPF